MPNSKQKKRRNDVVKTIPWKDQIFLDNFKWFNENIMITNMFCFKIMNELKDIVIIQYTHYDWKLYGFPTDRCFVILMHAVLYLKITNVLAIIFENLNHKNFDYYD